MYEIPKTIRNGVVKFIESCNLDRLRIHLREWAIRQLSEPRDILLSESIGAHQRRNQSRASELPRTWSEATVIVSIVYELIRPEVSLTGFEDLGMPRRAKSKSKKRPQEEDPETHEWREFKAAGVYLVNRTRMERELEDEEGRIERALSLLNQSKTARQKLGIATNRGRPPKYEKKDMDAEYVLRHWEKYTSKCQRKGRKVSIRGFIRDCEDYSIGLPNYDVDKLRKMIRSRKRKEDRLKEENSSN